MCMEIKFIFTATGPCPAPIIKGGGLVTFVDPDPNKKIITNHA